MDGEVELDEIPAVWTPAQAARFLAFVDGHELRALWHLALGTGARRGELLGLRWQDVDLDQRRICIQRALSVVDGVPRLLATKTSKRRTLSVAPSVVDALRHHQHLQERHRRDAADWPDRWGLVFTDEDGAPIDPMTATKAFRALVAEAPVPGAPARSPAFSRQRAARGRRARHRGQPSTGPRECEHDPGRLRPRAPRCRRRRGRCPRDHDGRRVTIGPTRLNLSLLVSIAALRRPRALCVRRVLIQ
jgi:integrase